MLPSCCCRWAFSSMSRLAFSSSKASTVSVDIFASIALNSASISAIRICSSMLLSSVCSDCKPIPMCTFRVCSTPRFCCAVSMMALMTARCRMLSSTVGELWQYFLPKSSRLIHLHTIFFCPFTVLIGNTVFLITGPAVVYRFFCYKIHLWHPPGNLPLLLNPHVDFISAWFFK